VSRLSYIKTTKTVRIERDGEKPVTIFISSNGPKITWRTNNGRRGSGEGFFGLHQLCDALGNLSKEEYAFLVANKI
jgi:hypothetical protein